jgi:hypothetical protein
MKMKFYHLLFYKFYHLAISFGNEGFYPEVNAWFLATLPVWANMMTVIFLLKIYLSISKPLVTTLMISTSVLWLISYFYFMKNDSYRIILQKMEERSSNNGLMTAIVFVYTIASLGVYGYVADL